MKKIFTLILSMVAFSTVSFAATEMDLSQWGTSGWGSEYDAETYTITYTSAWSGRGFWIGGADYSAYSSVTVTFTSEIANTIKLVVEEYDETNTNSSEFASASITGSGDATVEQSITVELGDSATNLSQMYIQAGATGTVTLVSAVLNTADEEEPQAEYVELYSSYIGDGIVLSGWSGTTLGIDPGSGTPELIASGLGEAGNILVLSFTDIMEVTEDASWGFKLVPGIWGTAYAAVNYYGSDDASDPFDAYDLVANDGKYSLELTETMISDITTTNWWGGEFIIQGDGLTLTKVEVMTPEYYASSTGGDTDGIKSVSVVKEAEADPDAPVYNLQGQRVTKDTKGILIQNGKKFVNK